ncbi:hypothetical protein CJF42_25270 [Pseudoalteromonas sp. NBT06-2]|uniref:hypothetical protein n=1 Tax=Pseudoalteromonas sp. NBT06-2 TaxID=2025950 RepID=UPI000BA6950C|nr:hypothetical protein [Pseudoalteromonas sp. NBT06-2]PAJ71708.1 hypothetical protein CJF42_25270 [Pseudoalteromonas sp. NBT06-2]
MKNKYICFLILVISFGATANEKPNYTRGDCITPIDQKFSWFGKTAKVEAYSSIDGFSGKNYILLFNNYQSNSVIFSKSIEVSTKKVDKSLCEINT